MLAEGNLYFKLDEPIASLTTNDLSYTPPDVSKPKDKYLTIEQQDPTTLQWSMVFDMSGTLGTYEINSEKMTLKLKEGTKYKEGYQHRLTMHNDLIRNSAGNFLFGQDGAPAA
jgi:hypothetical protein